MFFEFCWIPDLQFCRRCRNRRCRRWRWSTWRRLEIWKPGNLAIWRSEDLEIWDCGDLGTWKSRKLESKKVKKYKFSKFKSVLPKMSARSRLVGKNSPCPIWAHLGTFFARAGKILKLQKFCLFSLVGKHVTMRL